MTWKAVYPLLCRGLLARHASVLHLAPASSYALDAGAIRYAGAPITSVRRSFTTARKRAGLGDEVTPHILRHTFATWAVQAGTPLGLVAAAPGTSEPIVERVYGHHAPERLRSVVETVANRRR